MSSECVEAEAVPEPAPEHTLDTEKVISPVKNHGFNMFKSTSENAGCPTSESDSALRGIALLEPIQLYNILMQMEIYPCVSDPNYLLILDARRRETYDESHIELARSVPKNASSEYELPWGCEVETKRHIVVYDSLTDRLQMSGKRLKTEAVRLARLTWMSGSRHPVKILKGGYMLFSKLYPFLRTTKMIYLPRELDDFYTYPICVLTGKLYMGNWSQGNDAKIHKDLKISGFINCCKQPKGEPNMEEFKRDADNVLYKPELKSADVLHFPGSDDEANELCSLDLLTAIKFIDEYYSVMIFSRHGLSRAAALCIAYIMHTNRYSLQEAFKYCKSCNIQALPNQKFMSDLQQFEKELLGRQVTALNF